MITAVAVVSPFSFALLEFTHFQSHREGEREGSSCAARAAWGRRRTHGFHVGSFLHFGHRNHMSLLLRGERGCWTDLDSYSFRSKPYFLYPRNFRMTEHHSAKVTWKVDKISCRCERSMVDRGRRRRRPRVQRRLTDRPTDRGVRAQLHTHTHEEEEEEEKRRWRMEWRNDFRAMEVAAKGGGFFSPNAMAGCSSDGRFPLPLAFDALGCGAAMKGLHNKL